MCAVFGGSRGIGKAVAELLAQKGFHLAILARNLDVAQSTARDLGGEFAAVQGSPQCCACASFACCASVTRENSKALKNPSLFK